MLRRRCMCCTTPCTPFELLVFLRCYADAHFVYDYQVRHAVSPVLPSSSIAHVGTGGSAGLCRITHCWELCVPQDRFSRYPTYLYTLAHSAWKYGKYTGNSSYLVMQTAAAYQSNVNNTYGWQAYPASTKAPFICEVCSNEQTSAAGSWLGAS